MPFREKIAWLSAGGILVAFGPYFALVAMRQSTTALGPATATGFLAAIVTLVAVMTVASIIVALTNLRDAQQPLHALLMQRRACARRAHGVARGRRADEHELPQAQRHVSEHAAALLRLRQPVRPRRPRVAHPRRKVLVAHSHVHVCA